MNLDKSFKEEDREVLVRFLNTVYQHGKFDSFSVQLWQQFAKDLSYVSSVVKKKIEDHILEVKNVIEAAPESIPEEPRPRKKTTSRKTK